jgi:SAM-dependent methyltransferase
MSNANFTTIENANVYYQGHYWNDYEIVYRTMNERISGSKSLNWYQYFINTHKGRVFKKALFINCGNGWVEREMYNTGLFEEAVGVDYLQALVDEAQAKANEINIPLRYYQLDINTASIPEGDFDLVVNHAGCHHIAYLNKVLRKVCELMPEDGYFINFDYVGPHRNQYPYNQQNEIYLLNETLPQELRQEMSYPHLPTMLATDPTEAIHSELILEYTARYFNIEDHKRVGGALAYPLLTFNKGMQGATPETQAEWIRYVLARDWEFTEEYPDSSMFDYFIGKPKKAVLNDSALMELYKEEENKREENALKNDGYYYDLTLMQKLFLIIEDLKMSSDHMRSDLHNIYKNPILYLQNLMNYSKKKIRKTLDKIG